MRFSTFVFFSWISFPQAPEYAIRAISNFFENLRRGSRFTTGVVDTGDKWKKIFNHKSFNYFVWTPLGSRFCLQVHFRVSAAWYCFHYLPPASLTQVANFPPVSLILVAIGVIDTGHRINNTSETLAKFATSVNNIGSKFATGVVDIGGAPWLANISANFLKNLKQS